MDNQHASQEPASEQVVADGAAIDSRSWWVVAVARLPCILKRQRGLGRKGEAIYAVQRWRQRSGNTTQGGRGVKTLRGYRKRRTRRAVLIEGISKASRAALGLTDQ